MKNYYAKSEHNNDKTEYTNCLGKTRPVLGGQMRACKSKSNDKTWPQHDITTMPKNKVGPALQLFKRKYVVSLPPTDCLLE